MRRRRGVSLLPGLFTMGNMFCGYACVVYAMRGDYGTAAPFIGFAIVLDMLDGIGSVAHIDKFLSKVKDKSDCETASIALLNWAGCRKANTAG